MIVCHHICIVDWNDGTNVRVAALVDDDDVEIPVVLPDKSDMFVAYATVPGYRYSFTFKFFLNYNLINLSN